MTFWKKWAIGLRNSCSIGIRRRGTPALLLSVVLAFGCASVVRGTRQDVSIITVPPGAEILHQASGERWESPGILSLKRRNRHVLVVHQEGYLAQEVYIRSEASVTWWVIDAFSLGIGNILDAAIGGLFDLKPERVHVVLERDAVGESMSENSAD